MGNPSKEDRWALSPQSLESLATRLESTRPALALECGSGLSTLIMRQHCGHVVSLEHLPKYAARNARRLTTDNGTLVLTGIVDVPTPIGPQPFYNALLPDGLEFVLIDGPPESVGRGGTLFALWPHLAPGAVIWLDDYRRNAEQRALEAWREHLPISLHYLSDEILEIRRAD